MTYHLCKHSEELRELSALHLLPTNDQDPLGASPTMEAQIAARLMADMFDDGSLFLASFSDTRKDGELSGWQWMTMVTMEDTLYDNASSPRQCHQFRPLLAQLNPKKRDVSIRSIQKNTEIWTLLPINDED